MAQFSYLVVRIKHAYSIFKNSLAVNSFVDSGADNGCVSILAAKQPGDLLLCFNANKILHEPTYAFKWKSIWVAYGGAPIL